MAYALIAPKTWQASQALIVRNEAVGGETEPGKFRGAEDLKSIQETIMELSKSHGVLKATLVEVGPPADYARPSAWPTDNDIESLQKAAKIAPPKGVEFGTSEVFYLEVRDKDRTRVAALSSALSHQLQLHLQEIRNAKAQSMIDELNKAVQLASSDLQAATTQLTALEKQVGSDLPELRSLLDSNSSDTSLRRTVSEIENELRQFRGTEKANRQLLALLKQAQADPTRLMAAPNRLLDSQPALRRLKDGLVDAQLRTATLQGRMSARTSRGDFRQRGRDPGRRSPARRTFHRDPRPGIGTDFRRQSPGNAGKPAKQRGRPADPPGRPEGQLYESSQRSHQPCEVARAGRTEPHQRPIQQRQRQGRQPDHPRRCPRYRHESGQPERVDDRVGRPAGRPVDGFGIVLLTAPATAAVKTEPQAASPLAVAQQGIPGVALAVAKPLRQHATSPARIHEPWSLTVAAHGSLNCTQALKVLNEQGKLSSATFL